MANIGFEIERKWHIDDFPPLEAQSETLVEQAYLAFGNVTVRVSKRQQAAEQASYMLCFKSGDGLVRRETEIELAQNEYEALLAHTAYAPVRKKLRKYRLDSGEILECSLVDEGEQSQFYYAEIEFESKQAANDFIAPPFLGKELTELRGFTMAAYFRKKHKIKD